MQIFFTRTFAVAVVLVLTATGLWAAGAEEAPAAAADKQYVTDPSTGEVVVAREYGGTITYAIAAEAKGPDTVLSGGGATFLDGAVVEKLGVADWAAPRTCSRSASMNSVFLLTRKGCWRKAGRNPTH